MTAPHTARPPFFLVGSVRSGTTLLRDLLKAHPCLACPEETHFFRWPHPFGSGDFMNIQNNNGTLKTHRRMDGVSEETFAELLSEARTRRHLQDLYAEQFLNGQPETKQRWFDKTPQNVYGLLLLSAFYPEAKFVHIHRHPYNVVASLKAGKVMSKHNLLAAINTWLEAILIVDQFASAWPERIAHISYERLTTDPGSSLDELMAFLREAPGQIPYEKLRVHAEKNKYRKQLNDDELRTIDELLGEHMAAYGYA